MALRADPPRLEGVPGVAADALPSVRFAGLPAALRAADALVARAVARLLRPRARAAVAGLPAGVAGQAGEVHVVEAHGMQCSATIRGTRGAWGRSRLLTYRRFPTMRCDREELEKIL